MSNNTPSSQPEKPNDNQAAQAANQSDSQVVSTDRISDAIAEILRLAQAMSDGQLNERGQTENYSGDSAELITAVNFMLDSLITPLRLATSSIQELAHGRIPPDFVIVEYRGEFNDIKRSLNTFLAVLYGINHEMQHLIQAIRDGKLNTRGNDWDFEGCWKDMIAGLNETIDATIHPVQEARTVLDKLADYDLTARMNGKYRGDHAQIKKSLNKSLQSLQDAFKQVASAVGKVSSAADEISSNNKTVAHGATEQAQFLEELSASMDSIAVQTKQTAANTIHTSEITKKAHNSAEDGKTAMSNLLTAMNDIRAAAEGTQAIMQEINSITLQTDELAKNAAHEASRVGASARGFAVVADEVRKLAHRAKSAASEIKGIQEQIAGTAVAGTTASSTDKTTAAVAKELENMALQTNYLALNAAVEAAYVDATGSGIEDITEKVQGLAAQTKTSASKTEGYLRQSVDLAANGQQLSHDVDSELANVVEAVNRVTQVIDEIAQASQEQASELEGIRESISRLNGLTQINAESAEKCTIVSTVLMEQTETLSNSVNRFQIEA
jgi:methyl-accepting chemotaxis protein